MKPNDKFKILGYINLLEAAQPNGRHIHSVRNKLTALKMLLLNQVTFTVEYELQVKDLIHKLYTVD